MLLQREVGTQGEALGFSKSQIKAVNYARGNKQELSN